MAAHPEIASKKHILGAKCPRVSNGTPLIEMAEH
jgi:Zn ribbon nucleic-acid-binding protein